MRMARGATPIARMRPTPRRSLPKSCTTNFATSEQDLTATGMISKSIWKRDSACWLQVHAPSSATLASGNDRLSQHDIMSRR